MARSDDVSCYKHVCFLNILCLCQFKSMINWMRHSHEIWVHRTTVWMCCFWKLINKWERERERISDLSFPPPSTFSVKPQRQRRIREVINIRVPASVLVVAGYRPWVTGTRSPSSLAVCKTPGRTVKLDRQYVSSFSLTCTHLFCRRSRAAPVFPPPHMLFSSGAIKSCSVVRG